MGIKYNLPKYLLMAFFLAMAFAFFLPAGEAKADTDCDGGFCIYTGVGCGAHHIWVNNIFFGLDNTFSCNARFHNTQGIVIYSNLVPGFYSQWLTCSSLVHNITLGVNEGCFVEPGPVRAGVWGAPPSVDINDLGSTNVSLGVGYHDNLDSNMGFNYQIGNVPLVNEAEGHATGWKTFSKTLSSGCPSPKECRFRSNYPTCNGDPLCMTKADFTYWCWDFKNGGYVRIGSCNIRCDATYQVLAAVTSACCGRTASETKDVLVTCEPPPPPPTLGATLNANPSSGTVPLTSNLSTSIGGTATGPITYSNHSCDGGVAPSDVSGGSFRCQYNSAGTYVAGITVRRQGLTRNAFSNITVNSPANQRPTAHIDQPGSDQVISPGSSVSFAGHGTDPDGSIIGYQWKEGNCQSGTWYSGQASFTKTFGAVGLYRVYFRVQDDDGAWSANCPSRLITVMNFSVDGACGGADGGFFRDPPSSNLCDVGTPSGVSGSGSASDPWVWTCAGFFGGSTDPCSAQKSAEADNWKEVAP